MIIAEAYQKVIKEEEEKKRCLETVEAQETTLPMKISTGLTIVSLGVVECERKAFAHKNITPIGFKSERIAPSYVNPGQNCVYTNEVIDGGEKPLFRVTCAD
jgi:hypothetical protein